MDKVRNIHDLASLQKEKLRLEKEAKSIGDQLDQNFNYLKERFSTLAFNSLFCKDPLKKKSHNGTSASFLKSEKLNKVFDKLTDRVADKAVDGIDQLIDKLFRKNKNR